MDSLLSTSRLGHIPRARLASQRKIHFHRRTRDGLGSRQFGRVVEEDCQHSQWTDRGRGTVCFAKKKSKKGKGGKKNKESKFSALTKEKAKAESKVPPHESTETILDLLMLVESYSKHFNKPFLAQGVEITSIAKEVWDAPFVLMFHKLREEGLPTFCYANRAALALFESEWDDFVGMESRNTAEDEEAVQKERDEYLEKALETGKVEKLDVWRVSQKGRRFLLKDVELWNVESGEDIIGQAAICREWQYEDESIGNVETLFAEAAEEEEGKEDQEGEAEAKVEAAGATASESES